MNLKKSLLSSAVAATLSVGALCASTDATATVVTMSWTGAFTLLDAVGAPFDQSNPGVVDDGRYGWRAAISGTMMLDTNTGVG